MIIYSIVGLIKNILSEMSQYFSKPYNHFSGNAKVELNLSNYTTKNDLIKATGIGKSNLALKSNLTKLKAEVDKIDFDN